MRIRRIRITAHWLENPRQGWAGWIARISERGGAARYPGGPCPSFCDAIDAAAKSWRASDPCVSISTRDPSDAQKRKAWRSPLNGAAPDSLVAAPSIAAS